MSNDLNSFLNGIEQEIKNSQTTTDTAPAAESDVDKKDEVKEVVAEAVEESESTPTDEKSDPPSGSNETTKPKTVPLKALEEERHKRQEEERKNQDYERRIKELELHLQKSQPQPKPDFYEDPEKAVQQVANNLSEHMLVQKIEMSEYMARQTYKDYDEKMTRFINEAKSNPSLINQMRSHPHPGMFVYELGSKYIQMDEIGNLDAYKESLSEKLRQEIEAQVRAKYEKKSTKASDLPKSLSGSNSATTSSKDEIIDVDAFIKNQGWRK